MRGYWGEQAVVYVAEAKEVVKREVARLWKRQFMFDAACWVYSLHKDELSCQYFFAAREAQFCAS